MGKTLRAKSGDTLAKYIFAASPLLVSMFLMSCTSQIPVAANYSYTEQQKMQAAHHWQVLAADVVKQLGQNDKISVSTPLFVVPKFYLPDQENPIIWTATESLTAADTGDLFITIPFKRAYHNFLITQLVNAGYNVVDSYRQAVCLVTFELQVIRHNERCVRTPHLISALGRLLAGGLDGAYEGISATEYEVIITTSVKSANTYLARHTNTYYIDRPPWNNNYAVPAKTVEVVDQ